MNFDYTDTQTLIHEIDDYRNTNGLSEDPLIETIVSFCDENLLDVTYVGESIARDKNMNVSILNDCVQHNYMDINDMDDTLVNKVYYVPVEEW